MLHTWIMYHNTLLFEARPLLKELSKLKAAFVILMTLLLWFSNFTKALLSNYLFLLPWGMYHLASNILTKIETDCKQENCKIAVYICKSKANKIDKLCRYTIINVVCILWITCNHNHIHRLIVWHYYLMIVVVLVAVQEFHLPSGIPQILTQIGIYVGYQWIHIMGIFFLFCFMFCIPA